MALSDLAVRHARATGKEYTLADFDGLSLFVAATGGKFWHFRYYLLGKQKRMSLGTYPAVSLREARALRDEARALLAKGINPRAERRRKRQAARLAAENTFDAVYQQWLGHRRLSLEEGRQSTLGQIQRVFAKDVLPRLRGLAIFEITRAHLLEVIGRIERRKSLSVAEKVRTWLGQLFDYATVVVPGLEVNPAMGLEVVAAPLPPVQHNPFLRLFELPAFLRKLRRYPGELRTQLAVRLLLLTGVRTGELRHAIPNHFDLERSLWIIPPDTVKQLKLQMRRKRQRPQDIPSYIVPLSAQAIEIVRYMLEQFKPAQRYLFPGAKNLKNRISENTINVALKRIGYGDRLTGHGIRATISTALHEIGYPKGWIDAELSHADSDQASASYNHAEYVEQRRVMMQDWADRLDLFEQDQVEAASMHLTIRLEVPGVPGTQALASAAPKPHSPILVVSGLGAKAPVIPASVHRLSAVLLPAYAQAEVSNIQLDRMQLLEVFELPHNLSVADFAKIVGKSRRWISYEIRAGKLLALKMGNRGQRVPDWHFDPPKHDLIQVLLKQSDEVDAWQLYEALSRPHEQLEGRAPIDAVTPLNVSKVATIVLSVLRAKGKELSSSQAAQNGVAKYA